MRCGGQYLPGPTAAAASFIAALRFFVGPGTCTAAAPAAAAAAFRGGSHATGAVAAFTLERMCQEVCGPYACLRLRFLSPGVPQDARSSAAAVPSTRM
jgi:hypothetical protein